MSADRPPISVLFTAFEPSGDDHASSVIAALRHAHPDIAVYAWGGPKMERAGATLVERTGEDAVMGLPGIQKIREHGRINDRVEAWIAAHRPTVHVPVDSPAANFPICKVAKSLGCKVVHLVAPQIWAWGRWRIHKLRRRTDLVLCLLPFEEAFFQKRRVPARFVGHPLFDRPLDEADLDRRAGAFGGGSPRLALMPGSRPAEIAKSFPLLLAAYRELKAEFPGTTGVVAATTPAVAARLDEEARAAGGWPEGLRVAAGDADAVIRWCDLALVKSGTVTLQIARQRRPMVAFYKSNPVLYHAVARWIVATKFFTLPNVLALREIVPEFVPHFGDHRPIVEAARSLIADPSRAQTQREELKRITELFADRNAAEAAADAIAHVARGTLTSPATSRAR
ncbi:MAG: lipid-A-disaccharide synthase [Phycisphaerae bacterium]|nr:lipid-A-disaccharide synthase [Phycisphaerae bacterium]